MVKNSITNKISPCCTLPFSVVYWWVSNLTLNSESDRQFVLSKISQNGTISIDAWKVLLNSGVLEADASLTKAEFLQWFDCGRQPSCEQLKLIIEGFKISNWDYYKTTFEELNESFFELKQDLSFYKYNDAENTKAEKVISLIDVNTGDLVTYTEVTKWEDGTDLTPAQMDGVLYRNIKGKFYKLNFVDAINVKYFGAKGDGVTSDDASFQRAINTIAEVYKSSNVIGTDIFETVKIFIPAGKYVFDNTVVLKDLTVLEGQDKNAVQIVARNTSILAITNNNGFEEDGTTMINAKQVVLKNLTFNNCRIEMLQSWRSEISHVNVFNITGDLTAVRISYGVHNRITDLKVKNVPNGRGIVFDDNLGSGPTTSTYFEAIWLSQCNIGMIIDGGDANSATHGILTSTVNNSIFEYCQTGLILKGRTDGLKISNIHFEQNVWDCYVYEKVSFFADNWWTDTLNGIMFVGSGFSNNHVTLLNVGNSVNFYNDWKGKITVLGFTNFVFSNATANVTIERIM